jgi:hypothetical protein
MDYLLKYNCDIFPKKGCLICQDEQIVCCQRRNSIKCCRISAIENICIPAGHQVVIKGIIKQPKDTISTKWSLIEPTVSGLKTQNSLIIGRSLVDTENDTCPVRLMNRLLNSFVGYSLFNRKCKYSFSR